MRVDLDYASSANFKFQESEYVSNLNEKSNSLSTDIYIFETNQLEI